MQNIPSHNKDIRKMFVADNDYCLISTDYSQQEMRILAHATQDEKMIQSYKDGKDLYATIASIAFNKPYLECLERFPKGTPIKQIDDNWYYADENDYDKLADGDKDTYKDGKERRAKAKAITLGVCYGKGIQAIADDLKIPKEHAQEVYDNVMIAFPKLKQYMEDSQNMARELGYVTTLWGRKRRLPDMQLEPYEFDFSNFVVDDFDPLAFDNSTTIGAREEAENKAIDYYTQQLNKAYGRQKKEEVKVKAKEEGIIIKDNGAFIAQATRQCVNSRIQRKCWGFN
jgi:DNA polymerase I-like protein with 3'-5' exonuclease and polymerase domains